jgi:hypothetical protein
VLASLASASSGAIAHDLYIQVLRGGDVSPRRQLQVSRESGGAVAAAAVVIALLAKDKNVAILSDVAFAIAASTTTPVLLLTLYWRRFTRVGATVTLIGGLIVSGGLRILGPDVTGTWSRFGLAIPALVSVPADQDGLGRQQLYGQFTMVIAAERRGGDDGPDPVRSRPVSWPRTAACRRGRTVDRVAPAHPIRPPRLSRSARRRVDSRRRSTISTGSRGDFERQSANSSPP